MTDENTKQRTLARAHQIVANLGDPVNFREAIRTLAHHTAKIEGERDDAQIERDATQAENEKLRQMVLELGGVL